MADHYENSNTQGEIEMNRLSNQHAAETSIDVNWLLSVADSSEQPDRLKPRIQTAPDWIRSKGSNAECFEPLAISLGPIHSKNDHLQKMVHLKPLSMKWFASDCKVSLQELYDKVVSVSNVAKGCYEPSTLAGVDDTSFNRMMCLDGCFILWFVYMFTSDKLEINKIMNISEISHVRRDMILLETQIPWVILVALLSFRTNGEEDFIRRFLDFQDDQPLPQVLKDSLKKSWNVRYNRIQRMLRSNDKPMHLLGLIQSMSFGLESERVSGTETTSMEWSSFRSAKELKTAGIHFQVAAVPEFEKVSFKSNSLSSGTLFLPPLCVDHATKTKLLNMAAYEACQDASTKMEVTSFICFYDKLIDQEADASVLRSEGILFNQIGSDQQVAELFNGIAQGLVPNPNIYAGVRQQIESHYKNNCFVWIAHWKNRYLTTPWSVFGLLVGAIILMLTTTQTWYTVFPR